MEVEIRCPTGPQRLFFKLLQSGEQPKIVSGNLIELACSDCARLIRKSGRPVYRVLHRYDLTGELIETVEIEFEKDDFEFIR